MDVLEIKVNIPVSPAECQRARYKHQFVAPDSKVLAMDSSDSVLYQFIKNGSITVDSTNTYCMGVSLKLHHSQTMDQSLVLTQIRFDRVPETNLVDRNGAIVAKNDKTVLPKDCLPTHGACLVEGKSYLFDEKPPTCPYKLVRNVQLEQEEDKLVLDRSLGLLLNPTISRKLGCLDANL